MLQKLSKVLVCLLLLMICFMAVGCNDNEAKEKWADKIKDRYARYYDGGAKRPFTYEDLVNQLNEEFGESNYGSVVNADLYGATGILYWIDGDYTKEEIADRVNSGKKLKGLAVSFAAGLAVDAYYGDLKGWLY